MTPVIEFTESELWTIRQMATARGRFSRASGTATQKVDESRTDVEIDLDGMLGEMAVCKWFDCWPSLENGPDPGFDTFIGRFKVQVKATRHQNGKLLMKSLDDFDAAIAILAIINEDLTVRLPGWCSRRDFLNDHKPFNAYGKDGVALEQTKLRPISELMASIRSEQLKRSA